LTAGDGSAKKPEGVLTSFQKWLKNDKPVEMGWQSYNRYHAINRVANRRFAESRLKAAKIKIA